MDFRLFRFDNLSNFVGIFVVFFSLLIILYSVGFMRGRKGLTRYYSYLFLTLIASLGAVYANHLVLFLVFWGFLGLLLYLLIGFGAKKRTAATAKKTFMIIGGSDALILLGLAFVWHLAGTLQIDKINIAFNNRLAVWAYLCFAAGAFAKAGAMPLHSWIPDTAEDAPTPVTAYLPASLDKLLGIYFLARISIDCFQMNQAMNTMLMAVGSLTIVAAVMMALVQHDFKRLLGYHAVSQVGYMVLGIGTGNPVGIAGGLFHMVNNAIYKSCLFLSAGSVEKKTDTTNLERLGGLARIMPITFITFLIASFSISGVPPFNGFVSKWMVYQGVIKTAGSGGFLWVVWLVAALFGSALTLASFMKLTHAVFLGQPSDETRSLKRSTREASLTMLVPSIVLAALCVIFGVFAYRIPITLFIGPSIKQTIAYSGIWVGGLATLLILGGIIIGLVIYILGNIARNQRESSAFVGGEVLDKHPWMRTSGVEFYNTIKDIPVLNRIYALAQKRVFDIYDQFKNLCLVFTKILRFMHSGLLTTYLIWILLGAIILFFVLMR
jgi:NADH:ubiquinone oxidoreductase subunit 5 (subunit L)/multisubunit Na+/H+ antiporter MnhA subunit